MLLGGACADAASENTRSVTDSRAQTSGRHLPDEVARAGPIEKNTHATPPDGAER